MEEQKKTGVPEPAKPETAWNNLLDGFPVGKREVIFGLCILIFGLALGNSICYGSFNLGFVLAGLGCLGASVVYLRRRGKSSPYAWTLLGLCALILPGFARADDHFVKFVMACFLFAGVNLGLTTLAGQNQWNPAGVRSLLDSFRTWFALGLGGIPDAIRGWKTLFQSGGPGVKKGGAVLLGMVIAVPVIALMVPLLMRSDAAFEGLLNLLPEFELTELMVTVIFGGILALQSYTRSVALNHGSAEASGPVRQRKFLSHLTMNTVLAAVCLLYGVYLASQLAYFVGGFSGILPEGFSMAEYARRGFFEMAWLCVINLSVMVLGISLAERREGTAPLSTRVLCLVIGLMTEFLVVAAGAKMVLYIGAYGMTRLRVLTMVIMVFLGLTTAVVSLWLFLPKLPYMKIVVVSALVMGAAVLWADVDTVVAKYNVESYLSGQMEDVDVYHLSTLGSGAVPYLDLLADKTVDPSVREQAGNVLRDRWIGNADDLRAWNYNDWVARNILKDWFRAEDSELLP